MKLCVGCKVWDRILSLSSPSPSSSHVWMDIPSVRCTLRPGFICMPTAIAIYPLADFALSRTCKQWMYTFNYDILYMSHTWYFLHLSADRNMWKMLTLHDYVRLLCVLLLYDDTYRSIHQWARSTIKEPIFAPFICHSTVLFILVTFCFTFRTTNKKYHRSICRENSELQTVNTKSKELLGLQCKQCLYGYGRYDSTQFKYKQRLLKLTWLLKILWCQQLFAVNSLQ